MLDAVADSLEAKGLIKEAYEIDKVADELTNLLSGSTVPVKPPTYSQVRRINFIGSPIDLPLKKPYTGRLRTIIEINNMANSFFTLIRDGEMVLKSTPADNPTIETIYKKGLYEVIAGPLDLYIKIKPYNNIEELRKYKIGEFTI
jgi:hypothetical protein